jgi:hypothetical protein
MFVVLQYKNELKGDKHLGTEGVFIIYLYHNNKDSVITVIDIVKNACVAMKA